VIALIEGGNKLMQKFKGCFQILVGVLTFNLTAKASLKYQKPVVGFDSPSISIENSKVFTDVCKRLKVLSNKVDLFTEEIQEGILLDELIGQACADPLKYQMSSIAHKIRGL
jgi:hypothetical protein